MSELKAKLKFITGLHCDACLVEIDSNCKDMVEGDIYDCGVYDWIAYNLEIEIPKCSVIYAEVDITPSYWGGDIDEIRYSIVEDSVSAHQITQLEKDKAELVEVLKGLKIDAEKVIVKLCEAGCDEAWSVIKLNNMISDIDDATKPKCHTCEGEETVEDIDGNIWPCYECVSPKMINKDKSE